ncbi:hypothetical protein WJX75_005117 [Coccomyxa subellipsoidea]|uniref:Uncharacterized protein n=1 Tax=Coccomyxa subellipsoidea TaxID=248742 RepID=A0ABR2YDV3_9CHLO
MTEWQDLPDFLEAKAPEIKDVPEGEWIKRTKRLEEHQCCAMFDSLTAQKCCYCEALKLASEDRSDAMRAMVESQNLQLEACKLLLASRASTPAEEMQRLTKIAQQDNSKEADMLTQCVAILIKAAFKHDGMNNFLRQDLIDEIRMRLRELGSDGMIKHYEGNETPWGRAAQLSWPDLLAGICYLITQPVTVGHLEKSTTINPMLVCSREPWQRRMSRHGVPLSDMETILRIIQCKVITNQKMVDESKTAEHKSSLETLTVQNTFNIYGNYPDNLWNISLLADFARGLTMKLPTGVTFDICKVLTEAIKKADARDDEIMGSRLRWQLCYAILLGGEGRTFQVSKILRIVQKAPAAFDKAASWGVPFEHLAHEKQYWCCMGVFAKYRAAVREDPAILHQMQKVYAGEQQLNQEIRHVRCCCRQKPSAKLQRCSGLIESETLQLEAGRLLSSNQCLVRRRLGSNFWNRWSSSSRGLSGCHGWSADIPSQARAPHMGFGAHQSRCVELSPDTNLANTMHLAKLSGHPMARCKVLEGAVKAADEWDDEVAGSLLRWELCYAILLVGEGRDVSIFKVLSIAKEARAAMEKALSWGNETILMRRDKTYWPCVGVARNLNAAVRDRPGPEDKNKAALHD